MRRREKILFVCAESEWLNVEVLKTNINLIGKEKQTRIVKEGKQAIELVERIVRDELKRNLS